MPTKPIRSYRDLTVWQEAMVLAEEVYRYTTPFPKSEVFGLTSQSRRAAASIAANIAEGHGRESTAVFVQFLRISQGSPKELETHLSLAFRVGFLAESAEKALLSRCDSLGRMLRSLIRALQDRSKDEREPN